MQHLASLGSVSFCLLWPTFALSAQGNWIDLSRTQDFRVWKTPTGKWENVGNVELDPSNPRLLVAMPGKGVLLNGRKGKTSNLITRQDFTDLEVHLEFLIPRKSNSGVKFMGLYEIQLFDSFGVKQPAATDCGGIYPRASGQPTYHYIDKGFAPKVNAAKPAGEWQTLEAVFIAPRFSEQGKKVANAKFLKVVLNDQLIHENVEVLYPTGSAWLWKTEVPRGPLLLQADHGPIAFRNVRVRPFVANVTLPGIARTGTSFSDDDRKHLKTRLAELDGRLTKFRSRKTPLSPTDYDADVEIFAKSIHWALEFDPSLTASDGDLLKEILDHGLSRIAALEEMKHPWTEKKGHLVRGFTSAVDGSVQPYGIVVPAKYDPKVPIRLDVVLHGSSRPYGISEARFINRFGVGGGATQVPEQDFIELHPLGRVENCYRWAGETDVFEAIEAVCQNYRIDRDRIVLRGMSMGASGTWHLGLKHPDRFVALGPYCGYVDTHQFSQTPLPNFIKVGPLPPHQERGLHMLDSIDYAANAGIIPEVACIGDKDIFFQAHVLMGKAMEKEGLTMVNLISPGTGHVIDPVTQKEQMRRIGELAAQGMNRKPLHLRFVTWTLKYSRCFWLQVLGLEHHYARAELEANIEADGTVQVKEPRNVTRFAITSPVDLPSSSQVFVAGMKIKLPMEQIHSRSRRMVIGKQEGKWFYLGSLDSTLPQGKRPGLQGPIDDAFTTPFLCVRGSDKAWNPVIKAWSEANLQRFAHEWRQYMRGEVRIKDDNAVTEEDARKYNLILFGDPASNSWIRRVLPRLPIHWDATKLRVGQETFAADRHAPALIYPNPEAKDHYLVINSGHTFHEKEFASLNYLLFPRLGDWAVVKIAAGQREKTGFNFEETVMKADYFGEDWQIQNDHAESSKK